MRRSIPNTRSSFSAAVSSIWSAKGELELALRQFKEELFGTPDLILHTADICRNRNGFERLADRKFRERFCTRLNALMRSPDYSVVACAIRKEDHLAKYGIDALDPYLLSLNVLVERLCFEVGDVQNGGLIVAERRNAILDHELELAWLGLRVGGTQYLRGSQIERRGQRGYAGTGLVILPKN